ncbi:MAG: hypothetical protein HN919_18665 [Verrucomicrobia bacterium]|jgi:hypothetical protein|nr:hypothetical protein [Verrucomicrobiota bacterium]MBT7068327.1 hypothetical protein [Verrucomicrobiota bacterium]MBT7699857.1 hypothetical protein [Verrucomicrobiota bacterium]
MKKLIIAILCLTMVGGMAMAGTEAGDIEMSISVSAQKPKDGDTSLTALILAGLFVTSSVQLSGQAFLFSNEDGDVFGFVGAGLDLHLFPSADMVPYVGASATTDVGEDAEGDIYADVHAGMKIFMGENTSLNASVRYQALLDEFQEDYTLQGLIGVSFYL